MMSCPSPEDLGYGDTTSSTVKLGHDDAMRPRSELGSDDDIPSETTLSYEDSITSDLGYEDPMPSTAELGYEDHELTETTLSYKDSIPSETVLGYEVSVKSKGSIVAEDTSEMPSKDELGYGQVMPSVEELGYEEASPTKEELGYETVVTSKPELEYEVSPGDDAPSVPEALTASSSVKEQGYERSMQTIVELGYEDDIPSETTLGYEDSTPSKTVLGYEVSVKSKGDVGADITTEMPSKEGPGYGEARPYLEALRYEEAVATKEELGYETVAPSKPELEFEVPSEDNELPDLAARRRLHRIGHRLSFGGCMYNNDTPNGVSTYEPLSQGGGGYQWHAHRLRRRVTIGHVQRCPLGYGSSIQLKEVGAEHTTALPSKEELGYGKATPSPEELGYEEATPTKDKLGYETAAPSKPELEYEEGPPEEDDHCTAPEALLDGAQRFRHRMGRQSSFGGCMYNNNATPTLISQGDPLDPKVTGSHQWHAHRFGRRVTIDHVQRYPPQPPQLKLSEPSHHTKRPRRSSMTSSTTLASMVGAPPKAQRRVSFTAASPAVSHVEKLYSTEEEKQQIWYNPQELRRLQLKIRKIIRQEEELDETEDCWRGLEMFIKQMDGSKTEIALCNQIVLKLAARRERQQLLAGCSTSNDNRDDAETRNLQSSAQLILHMYSRPRSKKEEPFSLGQQISVTNFWILSLKRNSIKII